MPENNGDLSATCVDFLPVTAETNLSEDQLLGVAGAQMGHAEEGLSLPEDELSVNMVDAGLSYMLRQRPEDQREVRLQDIVDTKPFRAVRGLCKAQLAKVQRRPS